MKLILILLIISTSLSCFIVVKLNDKLILKASTAAEAITYILLISSSIYLYLR